MATTMERSPSKVDELYKGHKVVAMPSSAFGGKTLHEWVSSKNRTEDPMHRRSLSAGRAPMKGRDILKETYDRMGITTPRQHPWDDALVGIQTIPSTLPIPVLKSPSSDITRSRDKASPSPFVGRDPNFDRSDRGSLQQRDRKETFQKRYVSAAVLSRGRNDSRDDDRKVHEEEPRSRSLSRGRYRDWKWPPKKMGDTENGAESQATESLHEAKTNNTIPKKDNGIELAQYSPSMQIKKDFRPSEGLHPTSPSSWARRAQASPVPASPSIQDEKKEAEDGPQGAPQITPVKDRISALASRRDRHARQSVPKFSIHPPVIDIYEEAKKYEEIALASSPQTNSSTAGEDSSQSVVESMPSPSPAASAAANTAADFFRSLGRDQEATNRRSSPTGRSLKGGGVATAFLAAIQAPKISTGIQTSNSNMSAPLLEVPSSNEESPGGVDNNSVAMSSVSGDELSVSVKGRNTKWSERSKVVIPTKKLPSKVQQPSTNGYHTTNGYQQATNSVAPTQQNITMEAVERMVEERVQARIADIEARSEGLQRQLESRMEEKHKAQVDALDAKIEQLTDIVARLWSEQQSRNANGI